MVKFFLVALAFAVAVVLVGAMLGITLLWDWQENQKPGQRNEEDE